ncbi:MAG: hypothetical protein LUC22_03480 [Prevotella sp.]|nr:hypothetical protein [Prevotella sp.]
MYFSNKAARAKATLPITIVFVIAVALAAEMTHGGALLPAICTLIAAYLLELLGVRYSLMQGFTRLILCCFLLMSVCAGGLLSSPIDAAMSVLFVVWLLIIFRAYQRRDAPAVFFLAYICIGVISLRFVQILFYVPFLWLMSVLWLQAPGARNATGMVLGLLLPYWFWLALALYVETGAVAEGHWLYPLLSFAGYDFAGIGGMARHFCGLGSFAPALEGILEPQLLAVTIFVTLFNICGIVRFRYFSHDESIRNRMQHLVINAAGILALVFLVLQPEHKELLLRIIIICSSVSAAHYFAFSRSKAANALFFLFLAGVLFFSVRQICNF